MRPELSKACYSRFDSEKGMSLVFFAVSLFVLVGFTALAIDIGRGYLEQRRLQFAADAASMAAVMRLSDGATGVAQEARAMASFNGFPDEDLTSAQCILWNGAARTWTPSGCSAANAVHVEVESHLPMSFARIFGRDFLNVTRPAIAMLQSETYWNCIKPFGILADTIDHLSVGDIVTTSSGGAGNWGKLEIGGNMSSGNAFKNAMMGEGVCHQDVQIDGPPIYSATGFAPNLSHVFRDMEIAGVHNDLIFAIFQPLSGNYNGNQLVTITGFAKLNFVSQSGSGQNWQASFLIIEKPAIPTQQPVEGEGVAVLVY